MCLGERILIFELCLLGNPKGVLYIGILLEANFRSSTTNFGFGYPFRSIVGDSLRTYIKSHTTYVTSRRSQVTSVSQFNMGS